ncbi:MAG: hypothetical protein U5J97_03750 [Trueperaceae bacterium]|nr:hypothetical protein [Trueperaceae bacterium]
MSIAWFMCMAPTARESQLVVLPDRHAVQAADLRFEGGPVVVATEHDPVGLAVLERQDAGGELVDDAVLHGLDVGRLAPVAVEALVHAVVAVPVDQRVGAGAAGVVVQEAVARIDADPFAPVGLGAAPLAVLDRPGAVDDAGVRVDQLAEEGRVDGGQVELHGVVVDALDRVVDHRPGDRVVVVRVRAGAEERFGLEPHARGRVVHDQDALDRVLDVAAGHHVAAVELHALTQRVGVGEVVVGDLVARWPRRGTNASTASPS